MNDLLQVLDAAAGCHHTWLSSEVISVQVDKQRRSVSFPQGLMSQAMAYLHKNGSVDEESLHLEADMARDAQRL